MKKLFYATIAVLCLAAIPIVACAKGQTAKAPDSMPREKALVIQAATLQQESLAARVSFLQEQIKQAERDMKDALDERAAYLREYDIKQGDEIDFKTGAIKRKPPEEKKADAQKAAATPAAAAASPEGKKAEATAKPPETKVAEKK